MRLFSTAGLVLSVLMLSGCSVTEGWFGDPEDAPLPGERLSVLELERRIEADPALQAVTITLPPPQAVADWPQAGGTADHAPGHLALPETVSRRWTADIGSGSDSTLRLVSRPVVADGRIFAFDADAGLAALDTATGSRQWTVDLQPEEEGGEAVGGGVAFADGRLFATTGYGEALALNPANGTVEWRVTIGPVRGAPTVIDERVIVVTQDNRTLALAVDDGAILWEHTGILETAGLVGSVSAASDGGVVIVPYSSGELVALRVASGRPVWGDSLTSLRGFGALARLADIRGLPVINDGRVYAIGHGGRMVAIDNRSGARIWEQDVGGVNTPWPAGNFVFVLSTENELMALSREFGQAHWVVQLPRYEDPEDRDDPIVWSGPVLAGERLWLTSSAGNLVAASPFDGSILSTLEVPGSVLLPPFVAGGTLYVLTDDATLVAFR